MANYIYRKRSGEVVATTLKPANVDGRLYVLAQGAVVDTAYLGTAVEPPLPDGVDMSVPKMFDGTSVRNATAGEIAAFAAAVAADQAIQIRQAAIDLVTNDVTLRKVVKAVVGELIAGLVPVLNQLRQNPTTTFAALDQNTVRQNVMQAIATAIQAGTYD